MPEIDNATSTFGDLLKIFRTRQGLSQQGLAQSIGLHRKTIIRWEQGDYLPESKTLVLELARHLKLDEQETRRLLEASLTALSPYWSMPFPRNPYFTGREEILEALHTQLSVDRTVALTQSSALHGLGGVGKTQIALEYAYQHALEYSAVFWIGAETEEQVAASFLQIAQTLQLLERKENDESHVIAAVQHWLCSHGQWLLIWDNVEDLALLDRFLPATRSGALLLTTRKPHLGTLAWGLDLPPMEQEEGIRFLLRRAKVLPPEAPHEPMSQLAVRLPAPYAAAAELVRVLGGLPLALDQAGAYVEDTHCGLPAYLALFYERRATLLHRRGEGSREHPASVSTTLQLALQATTSRHPAGKDLLCVCALLHAEAIPEELFREAGDHLGAPLAAACRDKLTWDDAVGVACSSSLLSRQPEAQTLSMHRLVQAVLLDSMTEEERELWFRRTIEALNAVFPEEIFYRASPLWKQGERFLSHTLFCLKQVGNAPGSLPLASLAHKVAAYLGDHGHYPEAEQLYQRALTMREQALGPEHPDVARTLHDLATLCREQGKYREAEQLYQRALTIREQALGPDHPLVATTLTNLAILSRKQGQYEQGEVFAQRALSIASQALGPDHPDVAYTLNTLANIFVEQGKYREAEQLYRRALPLFEQALGPTHHLVAIVLNNLATIRERHDQDEQADQLYQRALSLFEQTLGSEHPIVAHVLRDQGILCCKQGRVKQAQVLYERALHIQENRLGQCHPETAETLHGLAVLWQKQGSQSNALALAERALSIREHVLGEAHPSTITTRMLHMQLVQEQAHGAGPTIEQIRTFLKVQGWSVHLKKRRGKSYVYATRKVGQHTQSRYLAPLNNLAACLVAAGRLPNARP